MWRATQTLYQQSLLHDHYFSTARWTATPIQGLWDTAWDQWDYQNGILHSPTTSPTGPSPNASMMPSLPSISRDTAPRILPPAIFSVSLSSPYSPAPFDSANTGYIVSNSLGGPPRAAVQTQPTPTTRNARRSDTGLPLDVSQ